MTVASDMTIKGLSGQLVYPEAIRHVLDWGTPREVRGRETLDAGFTSILLDSPYMGLPLGTGRQLSRAVAAAETLQLIGGFSTPSLMIKISDKFKQFLNGDGFHGAYGSRIKYQAMNACTKLQKDKATRQAVITLWDAHLDNLPDMNDYPCTVMLQFEIHNDQLCMNTIMRSNDVWLGLPYDMFQFTQLQLTMARALGISAGWYRHTALSFHIYVEDIPLTKLIHPVAEDFGVMQPCGIGAEGDSFTTIMKAARRLASGVRVDGQTWDEDWYRDTLAAFVG